MRFVTPVVQLGLGNVGRALVRQLIAVQPRYAGLSLCGLADSSALWLAPQGFSPAECAGALAHKEAGSSLSGWRPVSPGAERLRPAEAYGPALATRLEETGLRRTVVVDLTSSQDLYPLHLALRRAGHHLVLANKWPLTIPYEDYTRLWDAGDGTNLLLHETTVGAALPVIRPLEDIVAAGDRVEEIVASVSGTLGFVTSALMEGTLFSQAIREAAERGYTEPDPRVDLEGVDARRKALILARKLGMWLDMEDVQVESLLPSDFRDLSLDGFWRKLPALDEHYAARVASARADGQVLRYVAEIAPGRSPRVGLKDVPAGSVLASVRGTESLFMFRTALYNEQPLVVRGQGAGGALTASGVLAEILSVWRMNK